MIDPATFGAVPLNKLPVVLEHVRDLEYFDGPLLSEFKSSTGEVFLYHWCDCGDELNRWIVVRTPPQAVFRYLVGRAPLRDIIAQCRDRFVYLVDLDPEAKTKSAWFSYVDAIPQEYLPGPKSFHPRDAAIEEGFQDVYVNQNWDYEQVAEYPRRYLQTYAFHTVFGAGGNPKAASLNYNLTQGWVFHTLFEKMRTSAPVEKRATLAAVSFASPGYLRFKVDPLISAGVLAAVALFEKHKKSIAPARYALSQWANGHDTGLTDDSAKLSLLDACGKLGINGPALVDRAGNVRAAAKIFASYVSRLSFLAYNDKDETAMLVGLAGAS